MKQTRANENMEKNKVQNLVRYKSARYYARINAGGKETWKPGDLAMPGTLHSKGFTTATPQREKSLTFLVATIKPCCFSPRPMPGSIGTASRRLAAQKAGAVPRASA